MTKKCEWEPWIEFMLSAVEDTANWTTQRITAIRELLEDTLELCRRELPSNVFSKELIELIFSQPYCKISFVVDAGLAKRKTASEYLNELEKIGVLRSMKAGREKIFLNTKLLKLLLER